MVMTAATLGPVPLLRAWGDFPRSRYPRYDAAVRVGRVVGFVDFLDDVEVRPAEALAGREGDVLPLPPRAAVGRM